MAQQIVLTGIARSKGEAAGEALVNRQRMGWAFNHVGNEDGIVMVPGADIKGKCVIGKVVVYPTVMGSTTGAISLYFKSTQSHHGPAAIICQKVHPIDISGTIAGGIPAVDSLDQDPITTIKTGDWVEIDAPEVGQPATVTITRGGSGRDHAPAVRSKDTGKAIHQKKTTRSMQLTKYQQEMLDGKHGEAKKYGMEKLVDFGEAVESKEMVNVSFTLNACPIFSKDRRNPATAKKLEAYDLGHSPLFDPIFAMKDAHVADETGMSNGNDPYLLQLDKQEEKGYPWNFELPGKGSFKLDAEMVTDYRAGHAKLQEHGWLNWLSCTPQFNTYIPKFGEYIATAESAVTGYCNTILGARGNRESPIICLYAAYTGCLPKYGSHYEENRAAKCIVELDDETRDNTEGMADWGALGACIAAKAENRIMAVLNLPKKMGPAASKYLVSCCSPGMNDPIMHLMGYTPESPTLDDAFKGKMPKNVERFTVTMDDIVEMYRYLNNIAPAPGPDRAKPVDIVIFGCPHATFEEVREVARLLKGKKVKEGVMLWMQTDTPSYHMAHQYGDAQIIEEAGGKIYHQTCMAMTPFRHYPKGTTVATDSFKYTYLAGGMGPNWIYANPPALINAAVTGVFTPSARWDYWAKPRHERLASEKERPLYTKPFVD